MKHRQIQAFRSVMQTGTTAQAANLMSVTQPAVSRLIADLEIHLQFKLFERAKGRLHPTPEALRFYGGVERFFIGIEELDHAAKHIRERNPTDLKICVTPALSTGILPKAIRAFREINPLVGFQIETASFSQIALRLQTHQSNLGITHGFPNLPGLKQEPLIEAAHVCAMHESHWLAEKEEITPQDLAGQNVLTILPEQQMDWGDTKTVLEDAGVQFQSDIGIQSSHTGYALIAENLAVGLIEPFAAGPWRNNGVVTRPFEPKLTYPYVIAMPEEQPSSNMIRLFIKILRDIAQSFNAALPKDGL